LDAELGLLGALKPASKLFGIVDIASVCGESDRTISRILIRWSAEDVILPAIMRPDVPKIAKSAD
jgi:hypothetical protein